MHNSKIIVTVNPSRWEGDFRLWESLATGALIFVDPLFVPLPFPLLDGVHVVYYSNQNKTDLFQKLDYYRANPIIARKVAVQGYLYAMKHHRAVNLIDYFLTAAHLKRATYRGMPPPRYSYSAQYLNFEARRQQQRIKATDTPGSFVFKGIMTNHTHFDFSSLN
jgi:hypothetical protein